MHAELTDRKIAAIKAAPSRAEYKDGRWPLWLIVQPTGTKSFQWRGTVRGKDRRKALGRYYDGMSGLRLAQAREMALGLRASGGPPDLNVGDETSQRHLKTVRECFKTYMRDDGGKNASGAEKWRMWGNDIEPYIGDTPVADVSRGDLADIIARKFEAIISAGGNGVGANRLHSHLTRFFNWCLKEGWREARLEHSPAAHLKKLAEETVRDRTLTERELKWFFAALRSMASGKWNDQSAEFARGFELLLRLMSRRAEVFEMQAEWVDGDKLLIPRTKNGDPHLLWLHPSARSLIGKTGATGPVFAVTSTSMTKPIRRLRQSMRDLAAKEGADIPHWTLHDLRRTAATMLAGFLDDEDRQLVPPAIRERLLNHRPKGVMIHYDHHDYYAEKKAALKLWNDYLDRISNNAVATCSEVSSGHALPHDPTSPRQTSVRQDDSAPLADAG